MRILNLKSQAVYDIHPTKGGENAMPCPECSLTRKNPKSKSFSWNNTLLTGYCHNCESSFVEYKPQIVEKVYKLPEYKNNTKLTDKAVKYFEGRAISQEAINHFKIYSDIEYMPQFSKEIEVICFPYFKNDVLVNVKYRGANKSFKLVKDAELIFYNYDCIKENDDIIIVEGEMDCLALFTAGFKNVISVPNGANKNLQYLDDSISLFDDKQIILAVDNDQKGFELRQELIRRFGSENCKVTNFKDCKDANEYLIKYGGYDLSTAILNSEHIPVDGIISLEKSYDSIYSMYVNGLKKGETIYDDKIDELISWETGRLAVWTGIPSHGKSEILDWFSVRLNILAKWKVAYFSPENYPINYHFAKIASKLTGKKFDAYSMNNDEFKQAFEYIKNNFFFIYPDDNFAFDNIMEKAKHLIKTNGIKILNIDPYNQIEHLKERGESETEYISKILSTLTTFAKKHDVLINLVAHPRKMERDDKGMKYRVPNLYDINGSANFYNKADYGISIYRHFDDNPRIEIHILKVKFKHLGGVGMVEKRYNYNNGRLENLNVGVDDWDKQSYLI